MESFRVAVAYANLSRSNSDWLRLEMGREDDYDETRENIVEQHRRWRMTFFQKQKSKYTIASRYRWKIYRAIARRYSDFIANPAGRIYLAVTYTYSSFHSARLLKRLCFVFAASVGVCAYESPTIFAE